MIPAVIQFFPQFWGFRDGLQFFFGAALQGSGHAIDSGALAASRRIALRIFLPLAASRLKSSEVLLFQGYIEGAKLLLPRLIIASLCIIPQERKLQHD